MRLLAAALAVLAVAACSTPDGPVEIHDPYEATNRRLHEFNRDLDSAILRPTSNAYGEVVPGPVRGGISNMAANVAVPGDVINDVLQFRFDDAVHNTLRFIVNSTVGILGIFDPATPIGLEERDTGFGETLHRWGLPEGAYVEMPFFGPSTQREAVGLVTDLATNVVSYALEGFAAATATSVGVVDVFNQRYELGPAIDDILYESEDSYAAGRSIYLQNLRFRYSGGAPDAQLTDIYEDLYAE